MAVVNAPDSASVTWRGRPKLRIAFTGACTGACKGWSRAQVLWDQHACSKVKLMVGSLIGSRVEDVFGAEFGWVNS